VETGADTGAAVADGDGVDAPEEQDAKEKIRTSARASDEILFITVFSLHILTVAFPVLCFIIISNSNMSVSRRIKNVKQ